MFTLLRFIALKQRVCADDLALRFGLSLKAASMRLLRYHRRGWLRRMEDRPSGIMFYSLSEKGRQKMLKLAKSR